VCGSARLDCFARFAELVDAVERWLEEISRRASFIAIIIYIFLWRGLRHGVMWSLLTVLLALATTFIRMGAALVVTVAVAYAVGYARSRRIEAVALPILDILQSVPILGFFRLPYMYL
jgi:ABC-type proline/glycine betaine transport system permease subunit